MLRWFVNVASQPPATTVKQTAPPIISLSPSFATHPKNTSVTPFPATHPKSLDLKSFACHTYEKRTRVPSSLLLARCSHLPLLFPFSISRYFIASFRSSFRIQQFVASLLLLREKPCLAVSPKQLHPVTATP